MFVPASLPMPTISEPLSGLLPVEGHPGHYRLAPPSKEYSHLHACEVLSVHHWTDRLFTFTCTRDPGLRFENGQFTMIGIEVDGKPPCVLTQSPRLIMRSTLNSSPSRLRTASYLAPASCESWGYGSRRA